MDNVSASKKDLAQDSELQLQKAINEGESGGSYDTFNFYAKSVNGSAPTKYKTYKQSTGEALIAGTTINGKKLTEIPIKTLKSYMAGGVSVKIGEKNCKGRLYAIGRYQVIPVTFNSFIEKNKIDENQPFSVGVQKQFFLNTIQKSRKSIYSYISDPAKGSEKDMKDAAYAASLEWASLSAPIGYARYKRQNGKYVKSEKDVVKSDLTSAYINDTDKAKVSLNTIYAALKADRAAMLYGGEANGMEDLTKSQPKNSDASSNAVVEKAQEQTQKSSEAKQTSASSKRKVLSDAEIQEAIDWNKARGFSKTKAIEIQSAIGMPANLQTGNILKMTVQAIADFQADHGLTPDGKFGTNTAKAAGVAIPAQAATSTATATKKDANSAQAGDPNKVDQSGSSKYFSLSEMTHSNTANARKIDNRVPNQTIKDNLLTLMKECLDPIREAWGKPIQINSGYRSLALNSALSGSSKTSQHMTGEAADLNIRSDSDKTKILNICKSKNIKFDQFLKETNKGGGSWLHISYSKSQARGQVKNLHV